jgi:hypothetical protein
MSTYSFHKLQVYIYIYTFLKCQRIDESLKDKQLVNLGEMLTRRFFFFFFFFFWRFLMKKLVKIFILAYFNFTNSSKVNYLKLCLMVSLP